MRLRSRSRSLAVTIAPADEGSRLVDGGDLFDLVESKRIELAYAHDPNFAVSLSGVRGLPHQIVAVYKHMLPQPRLRFILADDPGAGKTIMAGLLLKELRLRMVADRVLVLCPAPLTVQWQDAPKNSNLNPRMCWKLTSPKEALARSA